MTTNYTFDNGINYTYDNTRITFAGGKALYKDLTPADSTFYAKLDSNINGNFGGGVLTGTATGGASIVAGKLDLSAGSKYVSYDAVLNAASQQVGCIRFLYTPAYSGLPATTQTLFCNCKQAGSINNIIFITHNIARAILISIYDSSGVAIMTNVSLGTWTQTQNIEYEFELNWDITSGATRLFIENKSTGICIQQGTTKTQTGVRGSDITLLRIGADYNGNYTTNGYFRKFIYYSTVQHTANYTPNWSTIPDTKYYFTDDTIITNSSFVLDELLGFLETSIKTGTDEIKYNLKKGTSWYYWNGTAWAVSNGTYAQANTAAEIQINKATFTTEGVFSAVKIFLHSVDGSTTPEIDNILITYNFANIDTISKCLVWWYNYKEDGTPDTRRCQVYLKDKYVIYKNDIVINRYLYELQPDSDGYVEFNLPESTNMKGDGYYEFVLSNGVTIYRKVPNSIDANISELIK